MFIVQAVLVSNDQERWSVLSSLSAVAEGNLIEGDLAI